MPKVSVIIPAHNAIKYLPKSLETVFEQTFKDWEVLIINDGSTDGIEKWASEITDTRVTLIVQSHQGVSIARNHGISLSQGEYIAFLDADDLWEPTKLEKQVKYLDNHLHVGLVYTWTAFVDESAKATGRVSSSNAEGKIWLQLLENELIPCTSTVMIRRDCFDDVGMFESTLTHAEDLELWVRISKKYPVAVIKEVLTQYRQHGNNTTKSRDKMLQGLHKVIEKVFTSVTLESLYLRNRIYGNIFLSWAWLSIDEGNTQLAAKYRQQAFLHNPWIFFHEKCLRLNLAIAMLNLFGSHGYDGIRSLTRYLKRKFLNLNLETEI
ncbi:glycosyltransferase family 2 protein [Calothrix sp. PCC 6303]|uniref:glycosyltransferase family 2 protein n=1 Tax=Calothrix sp. PCC 6303 TaxID=1170562 RepID=UPI0002A03C6A|nr:glycosyltransferase family A protein [Calothrix sp. PCC 6303]AFZ00461.1 glycosyl transferase family 2 [Calothrix sp. PCC 6303]